jgi:hypothetical protein
MALGRVLVVGLDPAMISGWDAEPVEAAITRGQARFGDHGIEADLCLVALDENAEGTIVEALTRKDYACVVIGGGIRKHEPLLEFFEKVVNLVRRQQGDGYGSPRVRWSTDIAGGCRVSSRECRNGASSSTSSPRTSAPTSSATRRQRVTPLWVMAKWKFSTVALGPSTGSPSIGITRTPIRLASTLIPRRPG